ncbi:MAG TPA: alpha/beta hydrolase-fold protein [Anaerolineae bacterium]|nr:alpha/beta hydrolase-fold protein [Anaerolineae bacterium]
MTAQQLPQTAGFHQLTLPPNQERFTLSLPTDYQSQNQYPLVLTLHWGGPVTPYYGASILQSLLEPALRSLNAIFVAPDCTYTDWRTPQSETHLINLLDYIESHYPINPQQRVVTGYSKGGLGSWYMAARHQDYFAAALPLAAQPLADSLTTDWQIPLFLINARQDEIFPVERTITAVQTLQNAGTDIHLTLLDHITHYQTDKFVKPLATAVPWLQQRWTR